MERISRAIQAGAKAFLRLEYTALYTMVLALFVLIAAAVNWQTGICYLTGAITSGACGYLGMWISTISNVKTAEAARTGLNKALRIAFNSGSVMGLSVVCSGLMMISMLLMAFNTEAITGKGALAGFGMGASTVAIFARVAGGIFTKAADVGADLVGKVEKNLPEDDARNPATIADNVGDNVGDVAGMGADLFSSFVGSIIASSLLGSDKVGPQGIALPFWISMTGIVASVFGMATVRCKEGATQADLLQVLRRAQSVAGIFQCGFMALITWILDVSWELYGCIIIGLAAGLMIGTVSEIFTSSAYPPVKSIAKSSRIGPANVVIAVSHITHHTISSHHMFLIADSTR
jgi:K(+)-stimulated pyrophosphate-energized sodium pump